MNVKDLIAQKKKENEEFQSVDPDWHGMIERFESKMRTGQTRVGTRLHVNFAKYGLSPCTKCRATMQVMNEQGLDWCILNIDELVESIKQNADDHQGGWETILKSVAKVKDNIVGDIPGTFMENFIRSVCESTFAEQTEENKLLEIRIEQYKDTVRQMQENRVTESSIQNESLFNT